jgi:hypothetical protein
MSKSDFNENRFIEAQFGAGSVTPQATLYLALHTADPGDAGNQQTNEATYTGYARQAIAVPAGWNVSGNQADNVSDIVFPEATAGSEELTHFSIGVALSGATNILYKDALSSSVNVTTGVSVKINAGNLIVLEQ